jgi:hypothetical protein
VAAVRQRSSATDLQREAANSGSPQLGDPASSNQGGYLTTRWCVCSRAWFGLADVFGFSRLQVPLYVM